MNSSDKRKPSILIAEDDPDDRLLLKVAFADFDEFFEFRFVENGEELIEYLHHRGAYAKSMPPKPELILLDFNMPKKDGREALVEIKRRADFEDVHLVIWTTSNEEEDRVFCAEAGASAYVTKPSNYLEMEAALRDIVKTQVQLPSGHSGKRNTNRDLSS